LIEFYADKDWLTWSRKNERSSEPVVFVPVECIVFDAPCSTWNASYFVRFVVLVTKVFYVIRSTLSFLRASSVYLKNLTSLCYRN